MKTPIILSIDEGTTNVKVIAVDQSGVIISKSAKPIQLVHPEIGYAEQSPDEIWAAVCFCIQECLKNIPAWDVKGVAITNQRESIVIWEKTTGKTITPLVIWQDRRTLEICEKLNQQSKNAFIQAKTGLSIDPLFPSTKISCLLKSIPNGYQRALNGELCVGTVDCWLNWKLSNGKYFSTDYSNASRTQLFNIHKREWDDELLALFSIPKKCLPKVQPSSFIHGYCGKHTNLDLAEGTPIVALVGDSHAALYGQCKNDLHAVKATYGTGSSLISLINDPSIKTKELSTTIAWHDGNLKYALEGNITHTGAGFSWIGKVLGVNSSEKLTDLALSVDSNGGVFFIPALAGLGAPHWNLSAKGLLCGLTDSTTTSHIARAALESIAYQIADVFFAMEKVSGAKFSQLYVDGGATKNSWLMQFQADLLQRKLIRNLNAEVSVLGAAYLAGKTLQWWSNQKLASLPQNVEEILPRKEKAINIQRDYQLWQNAVECCCYNTQR